MGPLHYRLQTMFRVPKVVTIFYYEMGKDFQNQGERHDFWEIVYLDKGEAVATAGETDLLLKQGEMLFHAPNEFHRLRANGKKAPNVFIITFDCLSKSMRFFEGKRFRLSAAQRELVGKLLEEAMQTFQQPFLDPVSHLPRLRTQPILGGQQMIRTYLEQLLILLMREGEGQGVPSAKGAFDNRLVQQIVEIMRENLYGSLRIAQLTARLNYGRSYLCGTFRQAVGCPMMEYYTRMKMEEAKRLLREEGLNVSQTADRLHYCSPYHFSETFKKYLHMSPMEYRRSIQPERWRKEGWKEELAPILPGAKEIEIPPPL